MSCITKYSPKTVHCLSTISHLSSAMYLTKIGELNHLCFRKVKCLKRSKMLNFATLVVVETRATFYRYKNEKSLMVLCRHVVLLR